MNELKPYPTPRTDAQTINTGRYGKIVPAKVSQDIERELIATQLALKEAGEALNVAISSVECASEDLCNQEELPWYKMARKSITNPLTQLAMNSPA